MARGDVDITTGNELLQYTGNANLAGGGEGEYTGQAESTFTPLQQFALKSYENNLVEFNTQEANRKKMEEMFQDENVRVPLDKEYADQVAPALDDMANYMKQNPQLYRDRNLYYQFMNKYEKALKDNAKLKTVQAEKDKYKKLAGEEQNEQLKRGYENHIKALEAFKLGDEIPAYNKRFEFNAEKALPKLATSVEEREVIDGNNIKKVRYSVVSALDADVIAKKQAAADGDVAELGKSLVRGIHGHLFGDLDDINLKIDEARNTELARQKAIIANKYKTEYDAYKKANPTKTVDDFIAETGKQEEYDKVRNRLAYLKNLEIIPSGGQPLAGYTPDDNTGGRLNVDDDTARAIFAVIENGVGEKTTVLESKVSKLPSEIKENEAQAKKYAADQVSNRIKANAAATKMRADARLAGAKAKRLEDIDKITTSVWTKNFDQNIGAEVMIGGKKQSLGFGVVSSEISYGIHKPSKDGKTAEILRPLGDPKPVYDKVDEDGKPMASSKLIGYTGGYYRVNYVNKGTGQPISEADLRASYQEQGYKGTFKKFLQEMRKLKAIDYTLTGADGTVDMEENLNARKISANITASSGEDQAFEPIDNSQD